MQMQFQTLAPAAGLRAAALAALFLAAGPIDAAEAEIVVPRDNIRVGVVIEPEHVMIVAGQARPGEIALPEEAIGLEARATLYRGRPIRAEQLGAPIIVERNSFVTLEFRRGALLLSTEARALDNGGVGDRIRVMNLDSRRTVFGVVTAPGVVEAR